MRVGLTYDLRDDYLSLGFGEEETAEFDRLETIDAIDRTLQDLGYTTDRIGNIRSLVARLAGGDRWDLVFNIAEGLYGYGREAQVPALLDAYQIPYTFSDPLVLTLTLHKGMAKHVVRGFDIPTPDFVVVQSESRPCKSRPYPIPLFAKPVAEGTGKGVSAASRLSSHSDLLSQGARLLSELPATGPHRDFSPGARIYCRDCWNGDRAKVVGMMEVILKDHAEAACLFLSQQREV